MAPPTHQWHFAHGRTPAGPGVRMAMLRREVREIREIKKATTQHQSEYRMWDLEVYLKSLIVTLTGRWQYSELSMRTTLYRDIGWDQQKVGQLREIVEQVFDVRCSPFEFLCARTLGDLRDLLQRALAHEHRMRPDGMLPDDGMFIDDAARPA